MKCKVLQIPALGFYYLFLNLERSNIKTLTIAKQAKGFLLVLQYWFEAPMLSKDLQ